MSEEKYYVTEEGLKKLKKEYENLVHVERGKVLQALAEARSLGDLSENADYDVARENQSKIETRIAELEKMLAHYEIIDTSKGGSKTVRLGSTVKVRFLDTNEEQEFTIVGSTEADPINGKLSNETPLAQAIMDKKAGTTVTVNVSNPYDVLIVKLK